MHASELWEGPAFGAKLARTLLTPASWLYAAGWQTYLGVYRLGLKKAKKPHTPIVCVGNLVSGGSGKTPVTLRIAELLRSQGRPVVVSCSGYGSPAAEAARIAPEGPLRAAEWGDEAAMFRWLQPDLPLIVGRRRVLAAQLCHERFPDAILLMDDGFQHLPLAKDLTIVLDPKEPKNSRCLPAGPYREPRSNRRRADLVLPGEFQIVEAEPVLVDLEGAVRAVAECTLLCALAQPQKVADSLARIGVVVRDRRLLPDHDSLQGGTLVSSLPNDRPVVVTAKDWVKLRERPDVGERDFLILKHAVRIEPEDRFAAWLTQRLDGIHTPRRPQ